MMRRGWAFGLEGQFEMVDDFVDRLGIFDEGDDVHLTSTVGTADAGKPTHRIAAIEILPNNVLNNRPEITVLLFKTILIFSKKPLEIMKEHTITHSSFRMTLTVNP